MSNYAPHPGRLLSQFFDNLRIKKLPVARHMGLSRATMHRVMAEDGRITLDIAMRLEQAFLIPARYWLDRQADYDVQEALASGEFKNIEALKYRAESEYALAQAEVDVAEDNRKDDKEMNAVA